MELEAVMEVLIVLDLAVLLLGVVLASRTPIRVSKLWFATWVKLLFFLFLCLERGWADVITAFFVVALVDG